MSEIENKNNLLGNEVLEEEKIQKLVEKYDAESRFRILSGWQKHFVALWLIAMSLYHLYTAGFGLLPISIHRAIHMTFAIVAVFLLFPASMKCNRKSVPWYDWILAIAAGIGSGYIVFFFNEIARRGAQVQSYELWMGLIFMALVIEAGRRVVGNVLPCLSMIFLAYCYFGQYMPGMFMHRGYNLARIIQHMYLTPEGIFGVALGVSSTFVFLFILFGAFLSASGGARFFNELSLAVAGHAPGGPAKVAIVASGLLGTISGSSVGNVATTGAFTIPLMKRVGYKGEFAGAVEACASTGGQLMPPIMGAGAFIMSEFLGISYLRIAAAAIVPAVIYYSALFINVHVRARKQSLEGIPKADLPQAAQVMKNDGHLLVPLFVIIYMLLRKYTPLSAAFWGIVSVVCVSSLRAHTRMGFKQIVKALEEGARGALGVALACALVGFIVGTSSLTALGLTISNNIIELAGGRLFPTLLMAMVACLVLGMGLPTTANYIVTSTIIAPALIKMNIMPLAAHMFVFYFGIMADLTPPVCLAAFTGAGIAGADPGRTGLNATRIALVAYLMPYMFIYTPMVLMENVHIPMLALIIAAGVMGILALAGALQGWMCKDLGAPTRALMVLPALAAFMPNPAIKAGSLVVICAMLFFLRKTSKTGNMQGAVS